MKRISVILAGSAVTLLLSAAARYGPRPADSRELHRRAEAVRLRAHFDSVDQELRARDISRLSAEQRAMRASLISWLRDYRNAGTFPENDRFTDRAMPFFRDSRGTLCAMAYLVDRSGRTDIVDQIAKTRNNAFIRELTDDRALVAWLDTSGLSVDEAARIQPTYGSYPVFVADQKRVSANYALLSMALGGSSLGSLGFNLFTPSRTSGGVGLAAGVATIIAGAAHLDETGGNKRIAVANTALGSLAAISALHALFVARTGHQGATREESKGQLVSYATISPDLMIVGSVPTIGVRLRAQF